jgi:hypothetical protein
MENTLDQELSKLKKSHIRFKRATLGILTMVLASQIFLSFTKINKFDVIRAKGIVI